MVTAADPVAQRSDGIAIDSTSEQEQSGIVMAVLVALLPGEAEAVALPVGSLIISSFVPLVGLRRSVRIAVGALLVVPPVVGEAGATRCAASR
jgi:hypothetical protein